MLNRIDEPTRKRSKRNKKNSSSLDIQYVEGKTANQTKFMEAFENNDLVIGVGYPGTGKTYLALYMALTELEINKEFEKIYIVRSSVSSRNLGFMPGNANDKMKEYEKPYMSNVNDLYGRGDAYNILKQKGIIEFSPTSYLRGQTFNNCIVILDEFQNLSFQELTTVITRFGENCKMVVIGDTGQDDLTSERYKEFSGARDLMKITNKMKNVETVYMGVNDIVRSGFVRDFIIAQYGIPEEFDIKQYQLI